MYVGPHLSVCVLNGLIDFSHPVFCVGVEMVECIDHGVFHHQGIELLLEIDVPFIFFRLIILQSYLFCD